MCFKVVTVPKEIPEENVRYIVLELQQLFCILRGCNLHAILQVVFFLRLRILRRKFGALQLIALRQRSVGPGTQAGYARCTSLPRIGFIQIQAVAAVFLEKGVAASFAVHGKISGINLCGRLTDDLVN